MMSIEERKAMVTKWAGVDVHYIVDRSESRDKWQKIRFKTINNWMISKVLMGKLKNLYENTVDTELKKRKGVS